MASVKVALITGSGKKRIGWHVAEGLAEQGYFRSPFITELPPPMLQQRFNRSVSLVSRPKHSVLIYQMNKKSLRL